MTDYTFIVDVPKKELNLGFFPTDDYQLMNLNSPEGRLYFGIMTYEARMKLESLSPTKLNLAIHVSDAKCEGADIAIHLQKNQVPFSLIRTENDHDWLAMTYDGTNIHYGHNPHSRASKKFQTDHTRSSNLNPEELEKIIENSDLIASPVFQLN